MESTEVQLLHPGDVEFAKMVVTTLRTQRDVIIGLMMDRETVSFIRFWNNDHWPCLNDVPEGRLYTCVLPSNGVAERLDRFIAWLESEIDCFQEPETKVGVHPDRAGLEQHLLLRLVRLDTASQHRPDPREQLAGRVGLR